MSGQALDHGKQGVRAFIAKPTKDATPPRVALAYYRLGQILDKRGKGDEAKQAYTMDAQLDPMTSRRR